MAATDFVTGYDHFGIPTNDMEATRKFYEALGFKSIYETDNNGPVVFYEHAGVVVETYLAKDGAAMKRGAIDHIALRVSDVAAAQKEVEKTGYPIIEGPCDLPFWENGIRYILVQGPNMECVEFLQML